MARQVYDIIILGGGVSGIGCAIYSARFNLKTLLLTGRFGGLIQDTHLVENYPGFASVSGLGLVEAFQKHLSNYKDVIDVKEEFAQDVKRTNDCFQIRTEKNTYEGLTIVFATGTRRRKMDVPGEIEFTNKGVSYCATCDAPLTKKATTIVVGGSDSAAKEALLLSEYSKKVHIVYRGEHIHPEPINMGRVNDKIKEGKIEIINNTNIKEIKGDKFVTHVVLDKPYNGSNELKTDFVFVEIGHLVESGLAKKLGVKTDDHDQIITDKESRTNVPGIFAAGDVTDRAWKQAITGVAEGSIASNSAYEYVQELKQKKKT